jgi:hypothetical protein
MLGRSFHASVVAAYLTLKHSIYDPEARGDPRRRVRSPPLRGVLAGASAIGAAV